MRSLVSVLGGKERSPCSPQNELPEQSWLRNEERAIQLILLEKLEIILASLADALLQILLVNIRN